VVGAINPKWSYHCGLIELLAHELGIKTQVRYPRNEA
jgi:hypothetical protein